MTTYGNQEYSWARAGLLHNMSAPSKTVLSHTGQSLGGRVTFGLPLLSLAPPYNAVDLLGLLDGRTAEHAITQADAEARLRARLDAHARSLALPPAAAVAPRGDGELTSICQDLLTAMTVLAKSSEHIYLRDKEPILDGIRPDRWVVLILPPGWRAK
jgi:hypothetical protein